MLVVEGTSPGRREVLAAVAERVQVVVWIALAHTRDDLGGGGAEEGGHPLPSAARTAAALQVVMRDLLEGTVDRAEDRHPVLGVDPDRGSQAVVVAVAMDSGGAADEIREWKRLGHGGRKDTQKPGGQGAGRRSRAGRSVWGWTRADGPALNCRSHPGGRGRWMRPSSTKNSPHPLPQHEPPSRRHPGLRPGALIRYASPRRADGHARRPPPRRSPPAGHHHGIA